MKKWLWLFSINIVFGEITIQEVIDQYPPEYCHILEAAYGEGMMSEGGPEAIDFMLRDLSLHGKKALDIGSGLGGVAYYLAKEHAMEITGLEINPWMVKAATENRPEEVKSRLHFVLSSDNDHLPFEDHSFDLVYSKGVLCQLEEKEALFRECHRSLKPGGQLVINDWVCAKQGEWGEHIQRLVELEGLSLHAETVEGYLDLLEKAGFREIKVSHLSEQYARYNEEIAVQLASDQKKESFVLCFGEKLHEEAIEGYEAIAKAIRKGEVLVVQFTACR